MMAPGVMKKAPPDVLWFALPGSGMGLSSSPATLKLLGILQSNAALVSGLAELRAEWRDDRPLGEP
jgi:hypothetical protein